ncbi:MAG TPA: RHS repeat-associated core domain-containing protein, partial [Bryobacteraceae bacterium]|nr:RHS repeat-associated core domain-containing protein [Bryobacteraceae bacterium]
LGRLTSDGTHQYTWNLASELIGYSGTDGAASFTYDGFGSRISRTTADGKTENYVLNYGLGLPALVTVKSAGADQRYYVYLPGGALLYAIEAATNSHHYYHFDENGSTEFLTDDTGHVTDRYGITPYGETVTSAGSTPNPFTWMGEWGVMREGSTPLYYMRFRYYDSATARFLSRDPIYQADPRSANPYQYALANPMSHADPMGLKGGITTATGFLMESNAPSTSVNATSALAIDLANGSEAAANARAVELTERMFDYYEWATQYVEGVLTDRATIHFEDWAAGTRNTPWVTWEQWLWNKVNYFGANRLVGEVAEAEANAARVSKIANIVRGGGTVLAGIGTAIQTGVAVVDDVHNGAGLIVTTTDAGSTLVSNVAMVAAPPLAVADIATGGAVSGGIHNALVTPNITARVVFGRTTSQDAHAIKSVYTRFAVGQYAWSAGEYYANTSAGEAATDFLAGVLGLFQ